MCLGIPGRVIEVKGRRALVDFNGIRREVDATLEEVSPGDYVIVHVGMIISKVNEEEAKDMIKTWQELLESLGD